MAFDAKTVNSSKDYFEMKFQTPIFFVALKPDESGHCKIDDSYYSYYENTLDYYYACLESAGIKHYVSKEELKHQIMVKIPPLLNMVNKKLERLRADNQDNHKPIHIEIVEHSSQSICSKDVPTDGFSIKVAFSFPCPIEND